MEERLQVKILNSLEKVFPQTCPSELPDKYVFSALKGERISFQLAFYSQHWTREIFSIRSNSNFKIEYYSIKLVPVETTGDGDENYISKDPGLYPDLLEPIKDNFIIRSMKWYSIWVDITVEEGCVAGKYEIDFELYDESNELLKTKRVNLNVINLVLPKQELRFTQWLHTDCLANYYGLQVFSEEYWEATENFIKTAHKYGINMILTPIFTPPLDTKIGGERTTVQLIDVIVKNGKYFFIFDNLIKWIKLLEKNNIEYIEFSHLFTQWGAHNAPKIMATVDGQYKQIFGWQTDALAKEYTDFLNLLLKELKVLLKSMNILDRCYFHISDEPNESNLNTYMSAFNSIKDAIKGLNLIDALSEYEFYKMGLVKCPIVSTDHIEKFITNGVQNLWAYYCCSQNKGVSNRFIAMPSWRNRVIATQLYKYNIFGFLHWGYNFYNAQFSLYPIDPYRVTDADGGFPAGDSFSVYPGNEKKAFPSIRLAVFYQGLCDLSAMKLLEVKTSHKYVVDLIEAVAGQEIKFDSFPKNNHFVLDLRKRINEELENISEK